MTAVLRQLSEKVGVFPCSGLHGHPSLFVQLHTAVCFGSARLALEMEYVDDAAVPFYPQSDAELQCYMRSLLHVRLRLSLEC